MFDEQSIQLPVRSKFVMVAGHMMTRTAQSCMIVSSICVLATLILGTASLAIKHAILSMIASTVCAAAGRHDRALGIPRVTCLQSKGHHARHVKCGASNRHVDMYLQLYGNVPDDLG